MWCQMASMTPLWGQWSSLACEHLWQLCMDTYWPAGYPGLQPGACGSDVQHEQLQQQRTADPPRRCHAEDLSSYTAAADAAMQKIRTGPAAPTAMQLCSWAGQQDSHQSASSGGCLTNIYRLPPYVHLLSTSSISYAMCALPTPVRPCAAAPPATSSTTSAPATLDTLSCRCRCTTHYCSGERHGAWLQLLPLVLLAACIAGGRPDDRFRLQRKSRTH
jgi:hypothetical protein